MGDAKDTAVGQKTGWGAIQAAARGWHPAPNCKSRQRPRAGGAGRLDANKDWIWGVGSRHSG